MPHRIHVVYDVPGWAYWRRAEAIQRHAPSDFAVTIGPHNKLPADVSGYDIVLLFAYGACRQLKQRLGDTGPRLLCGFNVGAGYRHERFDELSKFADHVIFNNRTNWDFHEQPPGTTWISNGVDRSVFRVTVPIEHRSPRALSIGSVYHLKHNNDLKGHKTILTPLAARLAAVGIDTDFRLVDSVRGPTMSTEQMVEWYNSGTVYVVASRCEGTPNPALEAGASGCVIVSAHGVGNMPELIRPYVNGELVDRNADAIYDAVVRCQARYPRMAEAMQERIAGWDWKHRAEQYYDLFRRLIGRNQPSPLGSV